MPCRSASAGYFCWTRNQRGVLAGNDTTLQPTIFISDPTDEENTDKVRVRINTECFPELYLVEDPDEDEGLYLNWSESEDYYNMYSFIRLRVREYFLI
jgi:hypothetical protein